jgi:hypothetical protein
MVRVKPSENSKIGQAQVTSKFFEPPSDQNWLRLPGEFRAGTMQLKIFLNKLITSFELSSGLTQAMKQVN